MALTNWLTSLRNAMHALMPHPQLTEDPKAERALRVQTNIHLNELAARIAMIEAEAKNIGRQK